MRLNIIPLLIFLAIIAISTAKPVGKAPQELQAMLVKVYHPNSPITSLEQLKEVMVEVGMKMGDKNGDGKMSKEEYAESFKQLHGSVEPSEAEIAANFTQDDQNKDGFVDKEEIAKSMTPEDEEELEATFDAIKTVQLLFKESDLNGDGKIAKEELTQYLQKKLVANNAKAKMTPEKGTQQFFSELDKNNDGFVEVQDIVNVSISELGL